MLLHGNQAKQTAESFPLLLLCLAQSADAVLEPPACNPLRVCVRIKSFFSHTI